MPIKCSLIYYRGLDEPSDVVTVAFNSDDPRQRQLAREILGEACINLAVIHSAKAAELGLPLLLQVRTSTKI